MISLPAMIERAARLNPDGVATSCAGRRRTWTEVKKRIGSLVVSADGSSCLGILSERDIVRELGKRGPTCMADIVDDMMTSTIETTKLGEEAESVLGRMTEGRFRHMPVIDDGRMIGIITLGDVVKARLTELAMEKDALEGMIMGH